MLIDVAAHYGDRRAAANLARHWGRPLPPYLWGFGANGEGVAGLRACAVAAVLDGNSVDVDDLVPSTLKSEKEVGNQGECGGRLARGAAARVDRFSPAALGRDLACYSPAVGDADRETVTAFVTAGLTDRTGKAAHRWFTFDNSYHAWAVIAADAAVDAAATDVIDQLADRHPYFWATKHHLCG